MRLGYIRPMKFGLSRKEQEAALRRSGIDDFSNSGPIYVERALTPDVARTACIDALRDGDELVVATPACLGPTRADVLSALTAINGKGANLYVVSMDATIKWSAEAAKAAEFMTLAENENAALRAKHARQSRKPDSLGGRKPRLVKGTTTYANAEKAWRDPTKSMADAAQETGFAQMTLYRAFGPKGTPNFGGNVGRKPKKSLNRKPGR